VTLRLWFIFYVYFVTTKPTALSTGITVTSQVCYFIIIHGCYNLWKLV